MGDYISYLLPNVILFLSSREFGIHEGRITILHSQQNTKHICFLEMVILIFFKSDYILNKLVKDHPEVGDRRHLQEKLAIIQESIHRKISKTITMYRKKCVKSTVHMRKATYAVNVPAVICQSMKFFSKYKVTITLIHLQISPLNLLG